MTLPVAIRSALEQRDVSFELLVVGDGVGDDTRSVMERFEDDPRVRFFDLPKGERHGERNRHQALEEATGRIVCYLSDDDILLPWHTSEMLHLLDDVDFAHSAPVFVDVDGVLVYRPGDLMRREFVELIRDGRANFIGLTGASHTRALYERLPEGWRPAPRDVPTDLHMWRQIFSIPGVAARTSRMVTAINFPDPVWRKVSFDERAAALHAWLELALRTEGRTELQTLLHEAVWQGAQDLKLRTFALRRERDGALLEVESLRAPFWKRMGRRALSQGWVRSLRDRRSRAWPS